MIGQFGSADRGLPIDIYMAKSRADGYQYTADLARTPSNLFTLVVFSADATIVSMHGLLCRKMTPDCDNSSGISR